MTTKRKRTENTPILDILSIPMSVNSNQSVNITGTGPALGAISNTSIVTQPTNQTIGILPYIMYPHQDQNKYTLLEQQYRVLWCCLTNNVDRLKDILQKDKSFNINFINEDNESPLYVACNASNVKIVSILLQHNANPNSNTGGPLPIMTCCLQQNKELLSLLIDKGNADINICNKDGLTPLMYSILNKCDSVTTMLINHKNINIDQRDIYGCTALYYACKFGNIEYVNELLNKANINLLSNNGYTPLIIAVEYGHDKVVEMILKKSKPNINENAFQMANKFNRTEIRKLLSEYQKSNN